MGAGFCSPASRYDVIGADTLFTVGYEGLLQPQLLDMLAAAGVATVLDVRAVPLSRKAGFSKSTLGESLQQYGLAYVHDRRLGTPKAGREAARRGQTGAMREVFAAHMMTTAALDGLSDAVRLATRLRTCLLCFEREPHHCHRSMVAEMIRDRTQQSIHHL